MVGFDDDEIMSFWVDHELARSVSQWNHSLIEYFAKLLDGNDTKSISIGTYDTFATVSGAEV